MKIFLFKACMGIIWLASCVMLAVVYTACSPFLLYRKYNKKKEDK